MLITEIITILEGILTLLKLFQSAGVQTVPIAPLLSLIAPPAKP